MTTSFKFATHFDKEKKQEHDGSWRFFLPFMEFYLPSLNWDPNRSLDIHSPDQEERVSSPDYYIQQPGLLIEVSAIHDREQTEEIAWWGSIIRKIREHLQGNPKLKKVSGLYLLETPRVFKFPTEKENYEKAADAILDAVIGGEKAVTVNGIPFKIKKIRNDGGSVAFSTMPGGGARAIDPPTTIHENIQKKLRTANGQLSYTPKNGDVNCRILLLTNEYIFGGRSDIIRALSYGYNDLLSLDNIDEIWLQQRDQEGHTKHHLLVTREFLLQFESMSIEQDPKSLYLFSKWFGPLEKLSDVYKEKLFQSLVTFFKDKSPVDVFPNPHDREGMVSLLGDWLISQERLDDVCWLIETFIDDPDPPEPNKPYEGEEENWHEKVAKGEDALTITTVRGQLAWVIQKLSANRNYISRAFDYTTYLLKYDNLYAKLQALVPLIEISARKQWLEEDSPERNKSLHLISLGLLRSVSQYKQIAEHLAHLFLYHKDLNTEEALEVLDRLKSIEDTAPLFIYFGIFRKRHFKNPDGSDKRGFDATLPAAKLNGVIVNTSGVYKHLQSHIAWNFWRILRDKPEEFPELKPWIDLFFESQPYERSLFTDLRMIIEDWVEKEPEICLRWFEKHIDRALDYAINNQDPGSWVWFDCVEPMTILAKVDTDRFLVAMEKVVRLWKLNAYIGEPAGVFGTFRFVSPERVEEVRERLKAMYEELKALKPKIQAVDFR